LRALLIKETTSMRNQPRRRRTEAHSRPPAAIVLMAAAFIACASSASAQPDGPMLASARREAARLTHHAAADSQAAAAPSPNWVVRHPVVTGALVGTGVGLVLSRVDAIGGYNHDPRVALIGAAVGAYGGFVASAVHKRRTGQRVSVSTKIGIVAGAVAAIVLPLLACYGAGGCGGTS
jgi:hypothetical protein